MDAVGQFLTILVSSALQLLLPIAMAALIAWAAAMLRAWRLKLGEQRWRVLIDAAAVAVAAAEQSGLAGLIAQQGAAKKAYAMQVVARILAEHGLRVNLDAISAVIEAVVFSADFSSIRRELTPNGPPTEDALSDDGT